MAVNEIIGYVLAGIGLLGIIASSDKIHTVVPVIKLIPPLYLLIASGILIIAGLAFLIQSGNKVKQSKEEVPIYEGEGRKRKIVGYQRMEK